MGNLLEKHKLEKKRRYRIRKKVKGTAIRPRISLRLSNKHIYAQCIDDEQGVTVACVSSLSKEMKKHSFKPNLKGAAEIGSFFGEEIVKKNIKQIVFDRGGKRYHGCVKAFAESVRQKGVKF